MKFTRTQCREKIAATLILNGQTQQMSDRTLDSTLDNLMAFAGEETELDAFVTQISGTFTAMDGNLRNESAERATAFNLANPKPKTAEELAAQKVIDDAKAAELLAEPAWAKANRIAQEERFAAMELKLTGADTAKTTEQRKADILTQMKLVYSPEFVDANANYFDFSKEDASAGFTKMCTDLGASQGITPLAGDQTVIKTSAADFAAQKVLLQEQGIIPKTA